VWRRQNIQLIWPVFLRDVVDRGCEGEPSEVSWPMRLHSTSWCLLAGIILLSSAGSLVQRVAAFLNGDDPWKFSEEK